MKQVNTAVRTAAALYRKDFLRGSFLLWSKNMARHRSLDGLRVYNCVVDSVLSPAPLCRLLEPEGSARNKTSTARCRFYRRRANVDFTQQLSQHAYDGPDLEQKLTVAQFWQQ